MNSSVFVLPMLIAPAAFSGTYDSALAAAEMAREELPGFPVRVMDSHCLAMCHGFAVLYAARAAAAHVERVVHRTERRCDRRCAPRARRVDGCHCAA